MEGTPTEGKPVVAELSATTALVTAPVAEEKPLLRQSKESEGAEKLHAFNQRKTATKSLVAQKLRPSAKVIVVEKEIELDDEVLVFNVRQHCSRECSRIDNKKYRRTNGGQLVFENEYAETVGAAWQIHESIMMDANEGQTKEDGSPMEPNWVRMYTLEEVLGNGKEDEVDVNSIMGNPELAAGDFSAKLQAAVWDVNPTLNPVKQMEAMSQLGMR